MNINKLKGKIVENGMSTDDIAKAMGMDRSTLYRKMNRDGDTFTIKEANQLCKILNLTKDEALAIFFKNTVA